jgi:uncharacterized protein YcnI
MTRGEIPVRRLVIVLAVSAIVVLFIASPAFAHVNIEPSSAPKGSDAVLTFVVPNEMDNATTTKVEVQFPEDHPIPEALTLAVPGWTADVKPASLTTPISTDDGTFNDRVDTITWTANSGTNGIAVGGFQEFSVSVGLPDDADSLTFPTIQTYSNNQQVKWIQQTPPGGAEPDHPAPELILTSGSSESPTASSTPTTASGNALPKNIATTSDVDSAKNTAIIGIVIGAIGVILAAIALVMAARRGRSTTST